jgi:hypothetical protein
MIKTVRISPTFPQEWVLLRLVITGKFYSNIENLVLRARSEMIGFAIGQVCSWFLVSGVRFQVSVKIES